jgi:anti-anti-sigma factor
MSEFACRARDADEIVVVTVSGDVDIATGERMVEAVAAHLVPRGRMVVDCSAVGFLDSSGLRGLLELRRLAASMDVMFALAAPSDAVRRVLELSGTQDAFAIADAAPADAQQTRSGALARYARGGPVRSQRTPRAFRTH